MKRILLFFIGVLFLSAYIPFTPFQPIEEASLFDSDEVLEVELKTNINELFRDREDERSYHPGTIAYTASSGEQMEIPLKLRVRGNFRRKSGVCRIPPIRLNFAKETSAESIFEGQDKLKLVTHCQKAPVKFMQFLLQEYLVYRIFNLVSEYSFKVRLLKITYTDEAGKWKPMDSYAFIIEDEDLMAERLGAVIKEEKIHPLAPKFDDYNTTLLSVFEYCIGNTDWSIPGMHNVKLLEREKDNLFVAVPYDFDWSGMVNPPYAVPNEILGLDNVRTRLYRGYKRDEALFQRVFDKFIEKKEEIFALYENCPGLIKSQRKLSLNYLKEFYRTIEDPKLARRNIILSARE